MSTLVLDKGTAVPLLDVSAVAVLAPPCLEEPTVVREKGAGGASSIIRDPALLFPRENEVKQRLERLLDLLQSDPCSESAAVKSFSSLPKEVKTLFWIAAWKAFGEPQGNYDFGRDVLDLDISLLGKIKTSCGQNIVEYVIHQISKHMLCKAWEHVIQDIHDDEGELVCKIMYEAGLPMDPLIAKLFDIASFRNGIKEQAESSTIASCQRRLLQTKSLFHRVSSMDAVRAESLSRSSGVHTPKRVLMVSYECSKVFKYGGLGEAVYGIGTNLLRQGHRVDLVMPKLDILPEALKLEEERGVEVSFAGVAKVDRVFRSALDGMKMHFVEDSPVDESSYVDHFALGSMNNFYEDGPLARPDAPWYALKERMAYFGNSVAAFVEAHKEEYDAVLFHDWHGAWAIDLLARRNLGDWLEGTLPAMGIVIHNNSYGCQGVFSGIEAEIPAQFGEERLGMNVLERALTWADHVVTVSPSFAMEMQGTTLGAGIDDKIRAVAARERLTGILNGSNPDLWDPRTDKTLKDWVDPITKEAIDLTYDPLAEDVLEKKARIAEQLQKWIGVYHPEWLEEYGIDITKGETMLYVGRYDSSQKGLDKFSPALRTAHKKGVNFICMGIASPKDTKAAEILDALEVEAKSLASMEGGKGLVIRDFRNAENRLEIQQGSSTNPGVGSLFRAIANFTYFPSEFEPCGLVQYEGWLFGALAIASNTGGLADTVFDDPASSFFNGFKFERCKDWHSEEQDQKVQECVEKAIDFWRALSPDEKINVIRQGYEFARKSGWLTSPTHGLSPIGQYVRVLDTMVMRAAERRDSLLLVTV